MSRESLPVPLPAGFFCVSPTRGRIIFPVFTGVKNYIIYLSGYFEYLQNTILI
jgi:hypothetical protein